MPNRAERKTRLKHLVYLHLCILLFSMTEVVGKFAALEYKAFGLTGIKVYVLIALMLCICLMYAFFWQRIIKHFDLHIAYANRAMYLVWSQVWATTIFSEIVTPKNILGMLVVMSGVVLVSFGETESKERGIN